MFPILTHVPIVRKNELFKGIICHNIDHSTKITKINKIGISQSISGILPSIYSRLNRNMCKNREHKEMYFIQESIIRDICFKIRNREIPNIRFTALPVLNSFGLGADRYRYENTQYNICFWKTSMNFPTLSELFASRLENQLGSLRFPDRLSFLHYHISLNQNVNRFFHARKHILQTMPSLRSARDDTFSSWFSIDPIIINTI